MKIHYFAAARAAAGVASEDLSLAELSSASLADLIAHLSEQHTGRTASGMSFAKVVQQCSFLVNGENAELTCQLAEADRVDVLPPFAGG